MATIIPLPSPIHLRAGMEAVRERGQSLGVSADTVRRALQVLLREMQAGRSSAAAVALANSSMRPHRWATPGDAA
mgnify:CR=1 FL=1